MEIDLEWKKELELNHKVKYEIDFESISVKPGIYIFGRRYDTSFEALYVGKATASLRGRIKTQLNNLKLMTHISNAKSGKRVLMLGEFNAKQKQNPDDCLPLAEKALIRHFVSQGHNLVNIHGVKILHHSISSTGLHKAKDFPNHIQIEVAKKNHRE